MLNIWHSKVGSRSTTYFQTHILTICGPIFFLKNSWIHSPGIYRTFKSDQYLCILLISSLEMHPWLHNNYLKSLTHGHWTHITLRFLLKNCWKLSLVAYTTFKLQWNLFIFLFLAWNNAPILKYLSLKIRSEPFFHFSKMAASSCIDN